MGSVREIPDEELLRRVIRHLSVTGGSRPLWTKVSRHFLLGPTFSKQLCDRLGFDPDGSRARATGEQP